jgi:uncharacterized repeat protein (TIGR03803 family)
MDGGPDTDLGSVFKIETDGTGYSQLHYCSWWVGFALTGRLLEHEGSLYKSATCYIGAPGSIVFKIGLDGSGFTILKWFDAMWAYGSLISTGEALFGTTASGGSSNLGTVFTVNTDGTGFGILKSFYGSDGSQPVAGMVMSGNTLYGTTYNGGISNCGVVFSLSLEPPTIITPPTSQTVEIGSDTRFSVSAGGDPFGYQWFFNDTNVITAVTTNSTLLLTNVQLAQAGAYTVRVSDPIGAVTSPPAMLGVITPVPRTRGATLILQGPAGSVLNLDYRETAGPNDNWTALDSVLLTNPPAMYCDPSVPLLKQRFYRAWHTNTLGSPPALKLSLVPALLLVGAPGDSLRLEYINPVGPVDAWVPLAVVPLANALQFYFDTSALGQPERLYRISPMP